MVIVCPWFCFYENLSLSKFIMGENCYLQMCCIRRMCMQNFLVVFQVQQAILLNTVAIQVQFKYPMAISKKSKD